MPRPRSLLLVEDDQVDSMTIKRALEEVEIDNRLDTVSNGEEALAYLLSAEYELPALILLDLNMPRMNGMEFLRTVKRHAGLKQIPVVVLTTSRAEQDISASFELGAAGYMVKPLDYREFIEAVVTIARYWQLSELPE
jgi:CheY-like chemotaxis protein